MEYKSIGQIGKDLEGIFFEGEKFLFYRYGDSLFYHDLGALAGEIDSRDSDSLYGECDVMGEDGCSYAIPIKFDDGYDEEEDDYVEFFCSGHHLCRLANPDSGEGHVLVGYGGYEAPHIGLDELVGKITNIQPGTLFDAVIMWRDGENLEHVTMKMGLDVGADDEKIFFNVEDAADMLGLMVGKETDWILVGFADGANGFNYKV